VSIPTDRFVVGSDQLHQLTQKIGLLAKKQFTMMRRLALAHRPITRQPNVQWS